MAYLTPEQMRVVGLIAVGTSIKEIAKMEGVKPTAIWTRLEKARRKMDVPTNVHLIAMWEQGKFNE